MVTWSTELLTLLRAPRTPANYQFLNQWATREHNGGPALSDGSNNPFFTTAGAGGTVGPLKAGTFPDWNSIGVARYPTLEVGVFANAIHIGSEYPAITAALRSGNPAAYANNAQFQSELTTWSGGGYSGFASIPAPAGPVGPAVDPAKVTKVASFDWSKFHWASTPQNPGDPNAAVTAPVTGAVHAVESVGSFLSKLTDPHYILRGLQIVAGGGLVLVGTVLLARQVALAADLPDPAGLAAKTSSAAPTAAVT